MSRLPEETYRYRKRNNISLEGRTSGFGHARSSPGNNPAADLGRLGNPAQNGGYLDARQTQFYAPHPGFMVDQSPAYFELAEQAHFSPTPPLRIEPGAHHEPLPPAWPSPTAEVLTAAEIEMAVHEVQHSPWAPVGIAPSYDDSLATQELTDQLLQQAGELSGPQAAIDRLAVAHGTGPDAIAAGAPQSLEQIVNDHFDQQMQSLDPAPEQQQPDPHEQMQMMYDQQMQMMFYDPWMMPGPM